MVAIPRTLGVAVRLIPIVFAGQLQAYQPPRIWLAPPPPSQRSDGAQAGSTDYYDLFEPHAAWAFASKHVSVFKIYPEVLRNATDEQVRRLIAELEKRHIALGLEASVLANTNRCGSLPAAKPWVVALVTRLKGLGADLREFAMVGPLVDGHARTGANPCPSSIDEVAAEAASTIAALRQMYPALTVGEIEPIGHGPNYPDWRELTLWFGAWLHASGKHLAFLHMDTVWGTQWQDDMRSVAASTRQAGIRFGVIYKGDPSDLSDQSFTQQALQHGDEVEGILKRVPDDVILQSWEDFPRHSLPDTDLSTMTGLVRAYVRQRTKFVLEGPNRLRLLAEDGSSISGAKVMVEVHDPRPEHTLQQRTMDGTTPHTAVSAIFGLRIHAECDQRSGPTVLSVGEYDFVEDTPQYHVHGDLKDWASRGALKLWGIPERGATILRLNVEPDRTIILNSQSFAVAPDRPFHIGFSSQSGPESDGTGCFALVFLGSNGSEIRRVMQVFRTSWRVTHKLHSGSDGIVLLPKLLLSAGAIAQARFEGDLMHRPSALSLDIASADFD